MKRKISCLILSAILIIFTINNVAYAQPATIEKVHYGPKIEDLKGKEEIIKNYQEMKRIRANLISISITENSTDEQLQATNKDLSFYLDQFNVLKRKLETHKILYKDSFSDLFLAEQLSLVIDSFILSIRQQQNLIKALQSEKKEDSQKLFYSNYLIPVYYYLTLGDQTIAYIEVYLVIT